MKYPTLLAMLCLLGLAAGARAQICTSSIPESTPTSDFVDHGDGTVTHTPTGLMWQRCAVGQTWSSGTCTGTPTSLTWANALQAAVADSTAGHTDWRLPNLNELESIVERRCYSPSINRAIFPTTPQSEFWSASAYASDLYYAWVVTFFSGGSVSIYKGSRISARRVRAGQSFGSFDSNDTVMLTVGTSGAGTVSGGSGAIDCGSQCSAQFAGLWSTITLAATPPQNLIAWGGACSGSAPTCTVTMDAAKTVSASFLSMPLVSGLPAALDFALRNIGSTSAARTLTLSNSGNAALSISSIAVSGDFAASHNCGSGLIPGGSCTLDVSFTPTAKGARSGALTIISDAPGSPHSVSLSGTGQGSIASLSPSAFMFADQMQGTTSTAQTLTLSNPGGATLNLGSMVVSGDYGLTTNCGATLAAGASCSLNVTFSPVEIGTRAGNVTINSDADDSPHIVTLSGTGLPAPVVVFNPNTLGFADQFVGATSATQGIVLSNTGAAALTINSIAASGDFVVSHNCGTGLGVGGFCNLNVTFSPTAVGARSGSITLASNTPGSPHAVSLTGTGVSPFAPLCSLGATPARVRKGQAAVLTASCNPAATSYTWSGGSCAGTTTDSCTVSPTETTTYSVTGTNGFGSNTANTTVRVTQGITSILMLLLE